MKQPVTDDTSFFSQESTDYKELFLREQLKVKELKNELEISNAQSRSYARELSQAFVHSKHNRRQLANANDQLVKYASDLRTTFTNLRSAHRDLQDAYRDTIFRLVLASEYKDKDTGNHITRISRYSTHLAYIFGLSSAEIESISFAAPMHDVGKIGIPDNIILKNGMLTDNEYSVIKTHTTIGAVILENSKSTILQIAQIIALSHHENWNGTGYPSGLHGEKIPLPARIVAISDTFDALTSKRPYKSPYPIGVACEIIKKERGRHFDPGLVDSFINHIDDFVKIKTEIDSPNVTKEGNEFTYSERDLICGMHNQIN
jgi:putative two-component system response regulator